MERGWIEQVQPIVVIRNSRYGLRAVRVGEASHPRPPRLRLVGTPSELSTTVPASSGEVRGAHGRFEVLAMDDDTDSVVSAVSFEEGFERDLGPPTAATSVEEVEPTQRASGADFSPVSRGSGLVSSLEVPTVRMDVEDSPSHSLVGALEQDLMSSPEEERGFIGLWPDQENAGSDGASVVSGEAPDVEVVETFNVPAVIQSPVLREALRRLDRIDLKPIFSKRAVVMKTVPPILKGPYRSAMHTAMIEATCDEHVRRSRGWKLSLLLPRMLLCRKPRGGSISREALQTRFRQFAEGQREPLIQFARDVSEVASGAMVRRRGRRARDDMERTAARAQVFVQMGELSSGRAAWEAAEVAPG